MPIVRFLLAFLTLLLALVLYPLRLLIGLVRPRGISGNVIRIDSDDPGLRESVEKARATLPEFIAGLSSPGVDRDSAAIKAPLRTPGGGEEHVWINDLRYEDGVFIGRVDSATEGDSGAAEGSEHRVPAAEISDWKLVQDGELLGGYSIRFFMTRMTDAQRAAFASAMPFRIPAE